MTLSPGILTLHQIVDSASKEVGGDGGGLGTFSLWSQAWADLTVQLRVKFAQELGLVPLAASDQDKSFLGDGSRP